MLLLILIVIALGKCIELLAYLSVIVALYWVVLPKEARRAEMEEEDGQAPLQIKEEVTDDGWSVRARSGSEESVDVKIEDGDEEL